MDKVPNPIVLSFADRLVEAASTACRCNDIPQGDPAIREACKARIVIERVQVLTDH